MFSDTLNIFHEIINSSLHVAVVIDIIKWKVSCIIYNLPQAELSKNVQPWKKGFGESIYILRLSVDLL